MIVKKYTTPIGTLNLRYKRKGDHWVVELRLNGRSIYKVTYFDSLGSVVEGIEEYIDYCIQTKDYTLLSDPFEMATLFGGRVFGRVPKLPPPNLKEMN